MLDGFELQQLCFNSTCVQAFGKGLDQFPRLATVGKVYEQNPLCGHLSSLCFINLAANYLSISLLVGPLRLELCQYSSEKGKKKPPASLPEVFYLGLSTTLALNLMFDADGNLIEYGQNKKAGGPYSKGYPYLIGGRQILLDLIERGYHESTKNKT